MITVADAKRLIQENVVQLAAANKSLLEAAGKVLAEDIIAPLDMPMFPQSSMDGYAFAFDGWRPGTALLVEGEIAAGAQQSHRLEAGKAVRIFTGAPVPPGADTVVMQEKVSVVDGMLQVPDEGLKQGTNVRPAGSAIKKGTKALSAGHCLSAATIGFIAGLGLPEVRVIPHPVISIIVTGNELQQPGNDLNYGQVYESNSAALIAALQQSHFHEVITHRCDDNLQDTTDQLAKSLESCDIILVTGGVSVGDYDFVVAAAAACGVKQVFHKVKQRPGKPLYFGTKQNKLVFGLPGNPSSVLSCFYQYVLPALGFSTGRKLELSMKMAPLVNSFLKPATLTFFLKGWYDGNGVVILDAQESYKLSSFAHANCLVQIDEETSECKAGEVVKIHLLPS